MEFLPCLYAFFGCLAFCFVFEVRDVKVMVSSCFIGFVSWFVFLLCGFAGSSIRGETVRYLIATVVVAILSEIFARIYKTPAVIFLIIGILPLVPGGGIYYTMESLINGDMNAFVFYGLKTVSCAGAIAVGCSFVSSFVRIFAAVGKRKR